MNEEIFLLLRTEAAAVRGCRATGALRRDDGVFFPRKRKNMEINTKWMPSGASPSLAVAESCARVKSSSALPLYEINTKGTNRTYRVLFDNAISVTTRCNSNR